MDCPVLKGQDVRPIPSLLAFALGLLVPLIVLTEGIPGDDPGYPNAGTALAMPARVDTTAIMASCPSVLTPTPVPPRPKRTVIVVKPL
jgi:hypothetical protein